MTGWTTITFEQDIDFVDDEDLEYDSLIDKLEEITQEKSLYATLARYHGNVVCMIGGYREWEEDEELLEEVSNLWSKAVVCQANDTGDIGHAKYYEHSKDKDIYNTGKILCLDEFEERELAHGRPVGAKSCAYMTLHHDIPCVSSLARPRTYSLRIVPNRNPEAWSPLKRAFNWFDSSHIDDEKIIDQLKEALSEMGVEVEDG